MEGGESRGESRVGTGFPRMGILLGIFDGRERRDGGAGRCVMGVMLFPTVATSQEPRIDTRDRPINRGRAPYPKGTDRGNGLGEKG